VKKSVTEAIEKIRDTYSNLVIEHGADARAGGYYDEEKRNLRYDRLLRVLDDAPEQFTIAELGCGYGAFYTYLDERMPGRISHYDGYDVSAEMLRLGREHLDSRPVTLMLENHVVREVDYVFISGIFNVKMNAPSSDWQCYIEDTLKFSFSRARRGLAFYLLSSSRVDFRNQDFYYYDAKDFMEFCNKSLSPFYTIDEAYPLYEMTCCVFRRSQSASP
jgi:SAM-dependent methyltransferase